MRSGGRGSGRERRGDGEIVVDFIHDTEQHFEKRVVANILLAVNVKEQEERN